MARRLQTFIGNLGASNLGYMGKWTGLASLIGFAAGLVAVGFSRMTEFFQQETLARAVGEHSEGLALMGEEQGYWDLLVRIWPVLLILPLGGLIVGWLIHTWAPEAEGHGTEQLVRTFHQLGGKVRKRVVALKALASAITIGTGGSAGQEGPVAQIGSGLGAMASDAFGLSDRDRRLFLLTGASAGIGALFTAPLAGALFAPEVLYKKPEFEGEAIIPCIISSIVAYTTFTTITGKQKAIEITSDVLSNLAVHDPRELGVYLVLALLCTLVGWFYVRTFETVQKTFKGMTGLWPPLRPALGGLLVALLAIGIGPWTGTHGVLYGGYDLMKVSIASGMTIGVMALLVIGKVLATSFSIAAGGSGGVFAPSLAIGAMLGAMVGQTAAVWFPALQIFPGCYALVGMGGFFAGVAKVPIASILIVCEMTGSYGLLAPLMLVSIVHLMLARSWTIYDTQVGAPADSPAHYGDFVVDVLEKMRVGEVVDYESEVPRVSQNATLRKALEIVKHASGSYFPVVDSGDRMVGIFSLSDIRRIFGETDVQDLVIVRDFMVDQVATCKAGDSLNSALMKMNQYAIHQLPVVSEADPRHVIGMLTRNNLGAAYHQRLRELRRR